MRILLAQRESYKLANHIKNQGTTGAPKGVLREAGGHAVGLQLSVRYLFGVSAGDVIWTASDIGWVGSAHPHFSWLAS
jgi:acyl-coenzyme A synthetase/AMP-(fatty) acid ligase